MRKFFERKELYIEMALVTSFDQYKICVFGKEGPIPHFHLRQDAETAKDEICIRMDAPEYFKHGKKQGELNSIQVKTLNKVLELPNRANPKITNWEKICLLWNACNYKWEKDFTQIPDYSELTS